MRSGIRGLVIALAVLVVALLAFSMLRGGMMGPASMAHGWAGLGMGVRGLTMLVVWGGVIVGVVLVLQGLGTRRGRATQGSPTDIVKRRYAEGEITRDQYEMMRRELEDDPPVSLSRKTP